MEHEMSFEDRDDGGLGLDEFLNYDPEAEKGGGGGQWLKPWKKGRQIDIWLHTESKIRAVWGHQIPHEIEVDEKSDKGEKTGRKVFKLSWPRFVSPDLATIHSNQYFRDGAFLRELLNKDPKTGRLYGGTPETAFMRDPFLILREYLYHAIEKRMIDPAAVVFEWVDHKNKGELIQWTAGEMSRQVKRGFKNRGHSLDTKLEYIFVVINHEKPGEGPKITRETKLLGDLMRDLIKREIESRGEDGDPFKSPYCIRWKFDPDSSSPMKSYDAFRIDKNACTPDVWQAIGGSPDPAAGENWERVLAPDTSEHSRINEGDQEKIRQIFEDAMQIPLPIEAIFSDDWEVRRSVVTGAILTTSAPRAPASEGASASGASRPNPGAAPGAVRPGSSSAQGAPSSAGPARPAAAASKAPTASTQAAPTPAAASGPQPRRKVKKEEPAPAPKEPEVEKFACIGPDEEHPCGYMLRPDEAKCPKCGTEYEIADTVVAPEKPKPAAPVSDGGVKRPAARTDAEQAELEVLSKKKCIGCGASKFEKVDNGEGGFTHKCTNCGLDQGDDIPF